MDNLQQKLTKESLNYHQTVKIGFKKSIIGGSIIATIISATPFLFNLYKIVPDSQVWDTFLFTYNSGWYESVAVSAYTLMGKFIPLLLIFIWFFTNRHWWYHVLLIPMAMYIYQIIEIINGDIIFTDTNLVLYLLPIMAIIIPATYLIRAKMFNKINDVDKTMEDLEEEFKLKPKGFLQKLGDYF